MVGCGVRVKAWKQWYGKCNGVSSGVEVEVRELWYQGRGIYKRNGVLVEKREQKYECCSEGAGVRMVGV